MRKLMFILTAAIVLASGSALAVDVWGGPPADTWNRGDPGTTFEHWNFSNEFFFEPEDWENPYGDPVADVPVGFTWGLWEAPTAIDPDGDGFVEGWHCINPVGGTITLTIPNTSNPNAFKYIYMQVTSSKKPSGVSAAGPPGSSSGDWNTGRPDIQHSGPAPFGGSWYTYSYGMYVIPNPDSETITIQVVECTVIDQIVVDTICTELPIEVEATTWGGVKALFR